MKQGVLSKRIQPNLVKKKPNLVTLYLHLINKVL